MPCAPRCKENENRVQYSGRGDSHRSITASMTSSTLLTPRQAAGKLGITYPVLKHWILAGRIRTIKTPGGHHRVPLDALR